VQYVETIGGGHSPKPAFAVKRTAVHNRMISQLVELTGTLTNERNDLLQRIHVRNEKPPPPIPSFYFDDSGRNTLLRERYFMQKRLIHLKLRMLATCLEQVLVHFHDTQIFLSFFTHQVKLMPVNTAVRIQDQFFAPRNAPAARMLAKIGRLEAHKARKEEEIAALEPPLWISNFKAFFDGLLVPAVAHHDATLSYAQPLAGETEISRYLFSVRPKSRQAEEIDELIDIAIGGNMRGFLQKGVPLALKLIPEWESRSPQEQCVGLMMFFRVIFDRYYEKSAIFHRPIDLDRQSILMRLSHLSLRLFQLPFAVEMADLERPIRDSFVKDPLLKAATLWLNEVVYVCNPIDALYFVHRAILAIHKAALVKSSHEKELTVDDLRQVLSFDDLFVCLLGALLSSDIPDFYLLADFVENYIPPKSLSHSFEYAQAAINALVVHFSSTDVEEFERQAPA
jgi:hypothetical protein